MEAQRDLLEIFEFSIERWGLDRASAYRDEIRDHFNALLDWPGQGPVFPGKGPRLRSIKAGQHRIFYQVTPRAVRIVRILHSAMNIPRHLR